MRDLLRENEELMTNIHELEQQETSYRKVFEKRRNELQVDNKLPHKNINYAKEESDLEDLENTSYTCQISIQDPCVLEGGHALLTFEDAQVAQAIIDKKKHHVEFSNEQQEKVTACDVPLGRTVTFEVNMNISNKKLLVRNLPDLPEETLKDKLELTFYKSNIGGGEIETVEYNKNNNTVLITYQENGVVQRVLKTTQHVLQAAGTMYEVVISAVTEKELKKLQIFSDVCQRTVRLAEIRNQEDSEEDIKDLIEIHFQKESNGGGEVEHVAFSRKDTVGYFEPDMA
ncbi:hypothetical protein GDO81_017532 [Engystomops pustulosus]|uniref:NID domain-containing protein n=1 Tax=Engystomops pustulosus TaxID=76066 RepID=A0AAV7AMM2_ENGPU|nr:hypothetical protein GDO81_017532 [Engystomops pustulosus]